MHNTYIIHYTCVLYILYIYMYMSVRRVLLLDPTPNLSFNLMATKRTHTRRTYSIRNRTTIAAGSNWLKMIGRRFFFFLWKISPRGTTDSDVMCVEIIRTKAYNTILRSNFLFPLKCNFLMEFSDCGLCKRI